MVVLFASLVLGWFVCLIAFVVYLSLGFGNCVVYLVTIGFVICVWLFDLFVLTFVMFNCLCWFVLLFSVCACVACVSCFYCGSLFSWVCVVWFWFDFVRVVIGLYVLIVLVQFWFFRCCLIWCCVCLRLCEICFG